MIVNMQIIERAREAKIELDEIKFRLKTNQISYEEARMQAKAPLSDLNAGMAEISKEHGFKHRKVNFVGFFR